LSLHRSVKCSGEKEQFHLLPLVKDKDKDKGKSTVLDSNLYLWLIEGGGIVLSHHCILLIRATTIFDDYLYCITYDIVHCTEEDPHQGSKRIVISAYLYYVISVFVLCYLCIKCLFDNL